MKKFVVRENDSLKNFTDNTFPQGSFYFSTLLKKRDIRVNNVKVDSNVRLKIGDEVIYYTTPAQENKKSYSIVYEDENLLVLDKESGVNSEGLFNELSQNGEYYFIHRLDRNTEGLIVFAKNVRTKEELLRAFKMRTIDKVYHAVCVGTLKKESAVLTACLIKDADSSTVKITETVGQKIVTEYKLIKNINEELNLLEITLHTGKTHQIRAHMAYIHCPVLGDEKYGCSEINKKYAVTRQCLLAKKLTFHCTGKLSYLNGKTFLSQKNLENKIQ